MGSVTQGDSSSLPEQEAASSTRGRQVSIHARLRQDTAALHLALDGGLHFLLEPALSLERYRQVLAAFHGILAPLEARLARLKTVTPPLCVPLPARTRRLEQDLRALGLSSRGVRLLPSCEDLPVSMQTEHLAGCLYVVEGASLGGQVIARAVERRLGLRAGGGASFFVGDGPRTSTRWKRVLAWLDELVRSGADDDEIVAGACETFSAFARWMRAQGVGQ